MRQSLISADIPRTPAVRALLLDAGITASFLYTNGSIPPQVVLIVKGRPDAVIGDTVEEVISKAATVDQFRGL